MPQSNGFNMSKVVITGATGFIGANLTADLARTHQVVGLTRQPVLAGKQIGVEWLQIPPGFDADVLAPILKGADYVVHLADSPERKAAGQQISSPVVVPELLRAMSRAGVSRMVVASSIYARLAAEGQGTAYGNSKLRIERLFQNEQDIQSVILRLPPVYGPGAKGGFATLVALVRRGLPIPFARANAKRAYLSVQNLSDLIRHLLALPPETWQSCAGQVFEPSDGLDISTADMTRFIADVLEKAVTQLPLPLWSLSLLGKVTGKGEAIRGATEPLATQNTLSLADACGWAPAEQMPESLTFLKGG